MKKEKVWVVSQLSTRFIETEIKVYRTEESAKKEFKRLRDGVLQFEPLAKIHEDAPYWISFTDAHGVDVEYSIEEQELL